jgi:MYXO-CTERM domain-containing protein
VESATADGCACRAGPRSDRGAPWLGALLILGFALRRRTLVRRG